MHCTASYCSSSQMMKNVLYRDRIDQPHITHRPILSSTWDKHAHRPTILINPSSHNYEHQPMCADRSGGISPQRDNGSSTNTSRWSSRGKQSRAPSSLLKRRNSLLHRRHHSHSRTMPMTPSSSGCKRRDRIRGVWPNGQATREREGALAFDPYGFIISFTQSPSHTHSRVSEGIRCPSFNKQSIPTCQAPQLYRSPTAVTNTYFALQDESIVPKVRQHLPIIASQAILINPICWG